MPNANVARGLQVGSDERALTFTEMDAHMSKSFKDKNVFWDYLWKKDAAPGASSADFPLFGESPEEAEHHVPGQFIEGGSIANSKVNVGADAPLIKALRLPLIDAELSSWDLIKPYADECMRLFAEKLDKRAAVLLTLAARSAAVANVHQGGLLVTRTGGDQGAVYPVSSTGADNLCADFSDMARFADDSNWPEESRIAFISPYLRQVFTRSNRIMNRDYTEAKDGSIASRIVGEVEGWKLVITRHLPSTNITTDLTKYNGDFRYNGATGRPAALFMLSSQLRGPVGAVQVGAQRNKVYFDENREAWLIKTRGVLGMGTVGVWQAGELRVKT